MFGAAALDPVSQVGRAQGGGGREDHRAELHHGEHRLPQFHLVAEHDHHPVAAPHPLLCQPSGYLVGAVDHLSEAVLRFAAVLFDDPQRRGVVVPRVDVEPVDRPVEPGPRSGQRNVSTAVRWSPDSPSRVSRARR